MSIENASALDAYAEGIPWMASDEYAAYSGCKTADYIEAVFNAMDKRRCRLSELGGARLMRLENEHESI